MSSRVLVVGAGGHGRAVAEILLSCGEEVVGFVDDAWPNLRSVWWLPVLGKISAIAEIIGQVDKLVVGIGNNTIRESVLNSAFSSQISIATVIHPRAFVAPSARIGVGTVVMAGAIIGCEAKVGVGCIINSGAVLDHHAVMQDYSHLGVGAVVAGGVEIGTGAWLQAGCAVGYGMKIDAWSSFNPGSALHLP